jgi:hypothetical protein
MASSHRQQWIIYEGVSKSFRTGRLERELQMVQLCSIRWSCIAIFWVSLVSFVAITLYVASRRVIPKVSFYFIIDSVRKLLHTPSYDLGFSRRFYYRYLMQLIAREDFIEQCVMFPAPSYPHKMTVVYSLLSALLYVDWRKFRAPEERSAHISNLNWSRFSLFSWFLLPLHPMHSRLLSQRS